jgi:hypothetical protein
VGLGEPLNDLHGYGLTGTIGLPADVDSIERHVAQGIEELWSNLLEVDRAARG